MAYDRNPKFGKDAAFSEGARRVADFLWENTRGDVSAAPQSYLENLRYEFSNGNVSMLELIDRVDLGPEATYEDYCEVVDALLEVDPNKWPDPSAVLEVKSGDLGFTFESADFSEFDFADEIIEEESIVETPQGEVATEEVIDEQTPDPLSEKMELFFKKIIASVYLDGVTEVTDMEGNPPSVSNNYLLSEDGKQFSGIFYDSPPNSQAKKYPFTITENDGGKWAIQY